MRDGRIDQHDGGSDQRALRSRLLISVLAVIVVQTTFALAISGGKLQAGTEDTDLYFRYAHQTLGGAVPYRDFLVEYPPLALPFFLTPALVTQSVPAYKVVFAGQMLACNALCLALVAWWVERSVGRRQVGTALGWYSLYFFLLSRLLVTRYDAAPMLVGFAATLAWVAGRRSLGGFLAAIGALIKVYPAVLVLVGVVDDWRSQGRGSIRSLVAFAQTLAVGLVAWLILAGPPGFIRSLRYQTDRGFEYGSLYAGSLLLAARTTGQAIMIERDHSSYAVVTPGSADLLRWVLPVQAVVLIGVGVAAARRSLPEPIRDSAAAVLGLIAAGKVFSPQFLIWLIPLISVLEGRVGRQARWLFAAVLLLTLLAQGSLSHWSRVSLATILVFNARNVLVVWLGLVLIGVPVVATHPRSRAE